MSKNYGERVEMIEAMMDTEISVLKVMLGVLLAAILWPLLIVIFIAYRWKGGK